eukprot:370230_1
MRRFLVCILLLNICQAKDFFRSITSIFDDDNGSKPCTFAASGINDVKLPKLSTSSTSADQFDFDHDFAELILDQIEDDYSVCTDPDTPDDSTSPAQHILMDSETLSPDIQGDQLFARRVIQRVGSDQKSKQFQKYKRKSTRKPSVSFPRSISPQSTQNYHLQPKNKRQSSTHLSDIDVISYLRAKTKFYESKLAQSQRRFSQYAPRPIYGQYNSCPGQRTASHQSVSQYPHSSQSLSRSRPPVIRPNSVNDITDFKQNSKREKSEEDAHNDSFEPQYWIDDKDRKNKDFEFRAKFLIFESESEEFVNSSSGPQKCVSPKTKSRKYKIPCEYKYGHSCLVSQQCKPPKTKVRKYKRPRDSLPRNSPYSSHHLHVARVLPNTKDLQLELSSDSDEESRSWYNFSSHAASVADTLSLGAAKDSLKTQTFPWDLIQYLDNNAYSRMRNKKDSNSAIHYIDIEDSDVSHEDTGERFNLNSTCFKYLSSRRNDLLSA